MCHYAECHYAECHYAECHYAECHYAECHYTECHYAQCRYGKCRYANCGGAKHIAYKKVRVNLHQKCLVRSTPGPSVIKLFRRNLCNLQHISL